MESEEEDIYAEEEIETENVYMQQVMQQKDDLERNLRQRRAMPQAPPRAAIALKGHGAPAPFEEGGRSGGGDSEAPAVDVRISGFWRFKNVVVPPNAYVVHTRRDVKEPLHIGLGLSFRFDPVRDSFLVVPATMQTIIISANCICKERQGLLVQGYVQWIVEDFETAYKKLDFSDPMDPMGIVNIQLREQAEATIKDTVATMSIDDVLSDKQPIIKELTRRLKEVVEGDEKGKGLGLRIVTVQIKEAVVSSPRVWRTLQRAFRAERTRDARLAELEYHSTVAQKEAQARQEEATRDIESQEEIGRRRAEADATAFDRDQNEKARRAKIEADLMAQAAKDQKAKIEQEAVLEKLQLLKRIEVEEVNREAENRRRETEIALRAAERSVENDVSGGFLKAKLIESLPGILSRMPKPDELKSVTFGEGDGLNAMTASLLQMLEKFGTSAGSTADEGKGSESAGKKKPRKK
ncbi:MAG: SPFH domain-containing protein [Planctomycetota bacterium]|jgi:hypothetical protein